MIIKAFLLLATILPGFTFGMEHGIRGLVKLGATEDVCAPTLESLTQCTAPLIAGQHHEIGTVQVFDGSIQYILTRDNLFLPKVHFYVGAEAPFIKSDTRTTGQHVRGRRGPNANIGPNNI